MASLTARIEKARPILDLIGKYESDGAVKAQGAASAYDVVWGGIRKDDKPTSPITRLTVERILWWQDIIDSRYQSEAAGRYQIMEDTLRGLTVDRSRLFDKACQDELALQLLDRRGWARCEAGEITPEKFADALAREWASLPVHSQQRGAGGKTIVARGQSYYAGDGLNKAHAGCDEVMAAIKAALGAVPAPAPEPPVLSLADLAAITADQDNRLTEIEDFLERFTAALSLAAPGEAA